MITTNERFENFIEDNGDRYSEIELRVLDLEKDISEWREARTREHPRPARRRQREHGAAGSGYPQEPDPGPGDGGYQADFTEPDVGLTWEADEPEPEWEDDERESSWRPDEPEYGWSPHERESSWSPDEQESGWSPDEPQYGWSSGERESSWSRGEPGYGDAATIRGAGAPRRREFLRATGQPPAGRDQGRTQALIDHGRQTARPRTVRRQAARPKAGRPDTGRESTGGNSTRRQSTGRQNTSGQDTGRENTSRQNTGRPRPSGKKTSRPDKARRGRSRHSRTVAVGVAAGLAVLGIGALIVLRTGPSWPASVASVRSEITTACQNPNIAAEPSQVDFACDKDTSQILWVFSLLTSGNDPGYADAKTGRKGLEPITPTQGGEIAWSLNLHHPYNPLSAVDSLEVAARAINNIIGGATLTSASGTPTVQPGLESKPENCARYTGSAAIIAHAGFPSQCASPVTSREGQAALVADVYKQWMPGASQVSAQNASVLFQNAGNPGDPQVQQILKSLPHGK